MSLLLQKIRDREYNWSICGDLKVAAILTGLQTGYSKYCYFLSEWDSRNRMQHYIKKNWPIRNTMQPGNKNVQHPLLFDLDKIISNGPSFFARSTQGSAVAVYLVPKRALL
ncbi:hypothetical protein HELRODRAFT_184081 [Helobdella robusta]|uniref:Uncharacterized protein n=1 Tax=Helobdella robusta TaxID=6412 RepID=T1FKJ5_HELRO|nr:hypothetical protein HELRODRAFT_184081 [Helobdella robusta]ESO08275.1 hypothetical protein HELRODRAFT_184081 [Helobdella robusta]